MDRSSLLLEVSQRRFWSSVAVPDLHGMPSTNDERPGSHEILSAVGAELVDMDSGQIHPTGFIDPAAPNSLLKFLAVEMLLGEGGTLLSPTGQRFVNELETREHVSRAIMELPPRGWRGKRSCYQRQWWQLDQAMEYHACS
jgi:hypothetical protein